MRLIDQMGHRLRYAARRASIERARRPVGRVATVIVCCVAGFMISVSAIAAAGNDLRPNRSTDLVELVRSQAARNKQLAAELSQIREQVDTLAASSDEVANRKPQLDKASVEAAMTPVKGRAVRVTLTDVPLDVKPAGVAGDLLVVHQQDIQAVVNALWAGGAEAMTIQGVRVSATTAIKCVGNSVVLKGVPYAPPYVMTAIGDPARLEAALAASDQVRIYQQYVTAYQLGYDQRRLDEVAMPGFEGSIELKYAKPGK